MDNVVVSYSYHYLVLYLILYLILYLYLLTHRSREGPSSFRLVAVVSFPIVFVSLDLGAVQIVIDLIIDRQEEIIIDMGEKNVIRECLSLICCAFMQSNNKTMIHCVGVMSSQRSFSRVIHFLKLPKYFRAW
jgi:hypothetical protein